MPGLKPLPLSLDQVIFPPIAIEHLVPSNTEAGINPFNLTRPIDVCASNSSLAQAELLRIPGLPLGAPYWIAGTDVN